MYWYYIVLFKLFLFMNKYFLYRHIRCDKNEPFYIGVGNIVKNSKKDSVKYKRAYSKAGRNQFWKRIDNKDFILMKEKEFIKLYGRKYRKTK